MNIQLQWSIDANGNRQAIAGDRLLIVPSNGRRWAIFAGVNDTTPRDPIWEGRTRLANRRYASLVRQAMFEAERAAAELQKGTI